MSKTIELREISILQVKKGQTGGTQPAVYSDRAASCLIPITGASPMITGHLIEQATHEEMEKCLGAFSAPEILHLGSASEKGGGIKILI